MSASRDDTRPTAVMVIPWLRQYVAPFFDLLRERLAAEGVQFELVYGTPQASAGGRGDTVDLAWAHHVPQKEVNFGLYSLNWQPYVPLARHADLVIVQQATRDLLNYVLLGHQRFGGPRVAFWGHGRSFFATTWLQRLSERIKRFITRQSKWFFAYNDLTVSILVENGYPADRITSIGNTLDTRTMMEWRDAVALESLEKLRGDLGLGNGPVGIYCGAMYGLKRMPFLIETAREVKDLVPDFELLVVGGGIDQAVVEEAARSDDWIHYAGPQFGEKLAEYFALADVFMLPGAVGLAVVDSFVFETPMITTSAAQHGPEIDYLEPGINGVMVDGDGTGGAFAKAVVDVVTNDDVRRRLVAGCRRSSDEHRIEVMVEKFADGVIRALQV